MNRSDIRFYGPLAGRILRELRGDVLQKIWAERTKLRQHYICRFENGEASFGLDVVRRYCAVNGVDVRSIINQLVSEIIDAEKAKQSQSS